MYGFMDVKIGTDTYSRRSFRQIILTFTSTKSTPPREPAVVTDYELDERAFVSQPGRPVPYEPKGAIDFPSPR